MCVSAGFAAWAASMCGGSAVQRPALVPWLVPRRQEGYVRGWDLCLCVPVCSFLTERFQLVMNLTFYSLSLSVSQISEEIKLCEAGECSYFRPQRRNILRNLLVSELTVPYPVLHGCSLPHNVPHIWTLHMKTKHCTIAVH